MPNSEKLKWFTCNSVLQSKLFFYGVVYKSVKKKTFRFFLNTQLKCSENSLYPVIFKNETWKFQKFFTSFRA